MSKSVVRATAVVALLVIAVVAGAVVTLGSALLGHQVLVLIYGENLAPIDDTFPMVAAVWTSYLAGILTGLAVIVFGWRRLVRRPAASRGQLPD